MKTLLALLLFLPASVFAAEPPPAPGANARPLFDGKTLTGWEGSAQLWRVEERACICTGRGRRLGGKDRRRQQQQKSEQCFHE